MKIIWKVLIKEIRQKPGRFVILTAGMTAAIFLITVMTVFSSSCLHAMILQEKKENGPYEAIFHDLTLEQAASLSEDPQIRQVWTLDQCPEERVQTSSSEDSASGRVCCGVSFKRISLSVFKRSQEVGEAIGMDVLPKEERPILLARTNHTVVSLYDITFNEKLLGYYGVNVAGTTAGSAWAILLLDFVIALFAAALLYYASLSGMEEKLKITGLLDGIGISEKQKLGFAFGENLLAGCLAIPAGVLLGLLALSASIRWLKDKFFPVEELQIHVNPVLLLAVLTGTILLALFSAQGLYDRVRKETVLHLISGYDEEEDVNRTAVLLGAGRHFFKAETLLAVKNVIMNHRNYSVSSVLLVIALCVFMNGIVYMEGLTSPPVVADQSLPFVSLWASAAGGDTVAIQEAVSSLEEIEGVDTVSVVKEAEEYSVFEGMDIEGMKTYLSQIQDENILSDIANYEENDMPIEMIMGDSMIRRAIRVIGVDDHTFQRLLGQSGETDASSEKGAVLQSSTCLPPEEGAFPLFIQGEQTALPILNTIPYLSDKEIVFPEHLSTSASPDTLAHLDGNVILYVPMRTFDEMMAGYTDPSLSLEVTLSRDKGEKRDLSEILYPDNAARRMEEDRAIIQKIEEKLRGSSLEDLQFYSLAEEYQKSFFVGGKGARLLLVTALVSTVWIASILITLQRDAACIRRRKKEFALLQSIGMPSGRIIRMIFLEHLTFTFAGGLVGIPLSIFILSGVYNDGGAPQMQSALDVPMDLVAGQIFLTACVVLIPFLYTVRELRKMDMIAVIRKEEA